MPTAWGLDPTAKAPVIETIIFTPYSREEDFMRHPPVIPPSSLCFAPHKFRDHAKSPMLHEVIGRPMARVRKRPYMEVTALSGEFRDGEIPQFIQGDDLIGQNRAEDRSGRIDNNAPHAISGCGELDQIVYAPADDPLLVFCCRPCPLGMAQ